MRKVGELTYREDDFTDPWVTSTAVLLQHGYCRNGAFWYPWVPVAASHYRVLRPDLRGCGDSRAGDVELDLEALVDDLLTVIEAADTGPVHHVGEGIGGVVGALAALREPSRFRSLVLLGMPTRVDDRVQRDLAVGYPSWTEAINALGVREWWLAARAVSGGLTGDPERDGWVADQVGRTPVAVAISLAAAARAWDFQQVLPEVAVPTLLLSSGNRFATTGPQQQDLRALLARSWEHRYEEVDDQFFMYHTTAAAVARDVLGFLRSVDEGRPGFVATALSTTGRDDHGGPT